jgi:prepilin-type N-terminal cleavage/methylation domain-containing protein
MKRMLRLGLVTAHKHGEPLPFKGRDKGWRWGYEQSPRVYAPSKRNQGFSLFELLIVLALIGMAAAVFGPSLFNQIDAARERATRDQVLSQITALAAIAQREGSAYAMGAPKAGAPVAVVATGINQVVGFNPVVLDAQVKSIEIPEGWKVIVERPIYFSANGYCSGGRFEIIAPSGVTEAFAIAAPFCDEAQPIEPLRLM